MSLFSKIFRPKPKKIVETRSGPFTLVRNSRSNKWHNANEEIAMSVRGTTEEPDPEQIVFLENREAEISSLNAQITQKFIHEFKEAELEANFSHWQDRFKIKAIDIMLIHEKKAFWNITFEDLKEPYTHFTLFIEGKNLTDFSIDT